MKRLKDNSDAPEARLGTLPKTCTSSQKKTKLHSARPRKNGYSRLRQQKSRRKESLWWIPELVCIYLNSAELETTRTSRSPTTVMTVDGELHTRKDMSENWTCS